MNRVPRDRDLLHQMYWRDEMSLPQMAGIFGVTHKSVERAMRELGITRRGKGRAPTRECIDCGAPVTKTTHAKNGSHYGRRCAAHQQAHKSALFRSEFQREEVKQRRRREFSRWYYDGPINPNGELQWINKGRSMLRAVKRILSRRENRVACAFRSEESKPQASSQV